MNFYEEFQEACYTCSSSGGRRTPTTFELPGSTTLAFYLKTFSRLDLTLFSSYERLSALSVRNGIVVRISLYYMKCDLWLQVVTKAKS